MARANDRAHRPRSAAEAEAAIAAADRHRGARGRPDPLPRAQGRAAQPAAQRRRAAAEERAATGKAANEARKALEAAIERTRAASSPPASSSSGWSEDRVDVTLPADPLPAIGRLHLITQTRREIEDVFIGLGFNVAEGPEVETVYYNFDALNLAPTHPARLTTDTFYVEPLHDIFDPEALLLRVHTSPVQIRAMERQPPPLYIIVPGRVYRPDSDATHTPQFHQIEGLAVDTDITLARPQGHAAGLRARDLRRRARGPPAAALLPVHRAERRGRRLLLQLRGRRHRRRPALPAVQGHGLDRDPRRRDGRPERVRARARARLRPRAGSRASRSGWGSSGSRCSSTASPTCGCSTTTTSASWSSSADARPACELAARVLRIRDLDAHALAERLAMTGTEVERVERHGVGALENFVVGKVLEARAASRRRPADACAWSTSAAATPSQIVCGAPNVAAGQTVAVAKPGRGDARRDQARQGQAARRRVQRDDPGRGRAGDRHRPRRDHGARRRTAWRPGRRSSDVLPIATDVLVLEITPNRPDCLGIYGVAREVHAATGAPLAPPPWSEDPGTRAASSAGITITVEASRAVPALHRARVRGRQDRPEPAVAEGAADGGRPAPDLQRRRHHQLRDAAHRPAAARVRPRPRRRRDADRRAARATASRSRRSTARPARSTPRWC